MKALKTHAAEALAPPGASPKARRMPKLSFKAAGRSAVLGLRYGPCDGTVTPRDSGDIATVRVAIRKEEPSRRSVLSCTKRRPSG